MNQLTIRGFDRKIEHAIRTLAQREKISLNKAAQRILHRGLQFNEPSPESNRRVIGSTLDHLAGTWSEDDARAMEEVKKDFERIDSELWP